MLAKLFGKKSDHPLANLKSAQQALETVPKNDSLKALVELTEWVESLREHANEFQLSHQVALLGLLDEVAQPHVRKLQREFFSVQPLGKFQSNRLWTALNDYFMHSGQVYADIFASCRKTERGVDVEKLQLALLATRAVVTLSNRLKLAAVRYARVDTVLWERLAQIYAYAETHRLLDSFVCLYPGVTGNTSVRKEFSVVMVWYSVGTGSLSPLHIHIAERLISYVNKSLEVGMHAESGGLWAFDLMQPNSPVKASGEATIHQGVRYFGAGGLESGLNELVRMLEKGAIPQDLNLYGAAYEAGLLEDVAHKLIVRCAAPLPTRRSTRRKLKVNLHVANGFRNLVENTDGGWVSGDADNTIWEVEDVSATGFLSVVSPALLDSVKIGSLIGNKPENIENWGVGIVRRLSCDAQNNLQVGVEILSNQVSAVSLQVADRSRIEETVYSALYLKKQNDNSGEAWLLMSPGTFLPSRSFNMKLEDKTYLLLSLGLIESGEDYDLARYRKMEQDTSE